ncbi:MAG: F0F1 ATP synthase subunit epsilon [candidate division KSB1 bacterium]|nr:F0F1 ATP synthase subunit epsilon [candidate division KSB1 bacterium]MDZ7302653.1 F0F1 ATP synthase subunit epsilon [candidate division KSB1 bacterium]MDZ7311508.1 F0F1 ATP synthase subunit epsilon [candidate division KSB1 bacterium]
MVNQSSKTFLLEIVTPFRKVFSERVSAIVAPGEEGYFGVLPGHTPLLISLKVGYLKVEQNVTGEEPREFYFAVSGGFAEVLPDSVKIFAETAEAAPEIDVKRAEDAKSRALKRLHEGYKHWDLERARAALARAMNRLAVAGRARP